MVVPNKCEDNPPTSWADKWSTHEGMPTMQRCTPTPINLEPTEDRDNIGL